MKTKLMASLVLVATLVIVAIVAVATIFFVEPSNNIEEEKKLEYYSAIGVNHIKAGQYEKAMEDIMKTLEIEPEDEEAMESLEIIKTAMEEKTKN